MRAGGPGEAGLKPGSNLHLAPHPHHQPQPGGGDGGGWDMGAPRSHCAQHSCRDRSTALAKYTFCWPKAGDTRMGKGPSSVSAEQGVTEEGVSLGKINAARYTQTRCPSVFIQQAALLSQRAGVLQPTLHFRRWLAKEKQLLVQGVGGCSLGFGHLPAAALDRGKNMYFHPLSTKVLQETEAPPVQRAMAGGELCQQQMKSP